MDESRTYEAKRNPGLIIVVVVVAVVAGYLGYFLGVKMTKQSLGRPVPDLTAQLPTAKIGADSIITSQEAVAVGKISNVDNGSLTMSGNDGKIAVFHLAPQYNIYPLPASGSAAPKASQDVKDIKLNQNYLVHLVLQNSNFVATTIQALPPSTK